MSHSKLLPALSLLLGLAGCGMETSNTTFQTRSRAGVGEHPLVIAEGRWVCPNVVTYTNQPFASAPVKAGEVEKAFGPYVPCLTEVSAGEGTCSTCEQAYVTEGDASESTALAMPMLLCPHCEEIVDPVALRTRTAEDARPSQSSCPSCKNYFTVEPADVLASVNLPGEVLCPGCDASVNPTLNHCTNSDCDLSDSTLRNVERHRGVCWMCGGIGFCANCDGSGAGNDRVYGDTPDTCWMCIDVGRCPECKGKGFVETSGSLPATYRSWSREGPLPAVQRKWRHASPRKDDGPEAGGE